MNNVISGRIKSRDGGDIHAYNNYVDDNCLGYRRGNCSFDSVYANPDLGDFRLNTLDNAIWGKGVEVDGLDDDISNHSIAMFNTTVLFSAKRSPCPTTAEM